MKASTVEKVIEKGVQIVSEFLPLKNYLYFPVLYSACIWAIRRREEWKGEIFSWQVWLEPDAIEVKPDEFVLNFFESHPGLQKAYKEEIKTKDFKMLRAAFRALYPVVGLEDPFLQALFKSELDSRDYKEIASEFEARVNKAKDDIEAVEEKSRFIEGLKSFGQEILALSLYLLSDSHIQELIIKEVKKVKDKR